MKISPNSNVLTKNQLLKLISVIFALTCGITIAAAITLQVDVLSIVLPALATIIIFSIFAMILKWQVGDNLFGELGFLYMALIVAYTLFPALSFLIVDSSGVFLEKIAIILPTRTELGIHLWRHVIFLTGVAIGYLLLRGRKTPKFVRTNDPEGKDGSTIFILLGIVAICILCISLLSAPVTNYIENYTRYNHLPWFLRKFVSTCIRLKTGIYCILIYYLYNNYNKYKLIIPAIVGTICLHELVFSFGARIDALVILLIAFCSHHYLVKSVTLKRGLIICTILAMLFSALELFRSAEFDINAAQNVISTEGFKPASEFGAVYFTSFHLYTERTQGTMAATEWPMFFNDFISIVTFGDFNRWNPQYWFARNYFPDAVVPPESMGPIADSAIWGGEIDLILRSLINGAFFAYLVRWFIHHKDKWWGVVIYVYCYATCIMTLKYSIFYHLSPLIKTLLPTLFLVELVRRFVPPKRKRRIPIPGPIVCLEQDASNGQNV